jgi:hypothetical protein
MLPSMKGSVKMWLFAIAITLGSCINVWADGNARATTASLPSPTPRPVAEVVAMVGNATVTREGGTAPIPLAVSDVLYEHDTIMTSGDSKIKIRFAEDSLVTLGPLGTLVLSVAHVRLAEGERQVTLTMTSGIIRALVQLLTHQESFVLRTPTIEGAVRGTEFGAVLKQDSTGIYVKRGKVVVRNREPDGEGGVTLTDGEGTDVDMSVAGIVTRTVPQKWGAARVNAWLDATNIPDPASP